MSRYTRRAALVFWDASVRLSRGGHYLTARHFSRLAGELLGVELAAPISLALGGVR